MKRSIVIIACVIAAVVIIPLVAQTSRSGDAAKVCPMGQGQACKAQCEAGKNCEDCPKKASGECQGCQKQCEDGQGCAQCPEAGQCKTSCDKAEGEASEAGQGCGMGQGMMRQGCGMGGGCGMGQTSEI